MDPSSSSSSVHDKLAMYKGLINICERERKNQLHDSTLLMKENEQKITDLRSEIGKLRVRLSMAEKGVTAEVATCLQENKALQLIFQGKTIQEMKEDLLQRNAAQKLCLNKLTAEVIAAGKKLEGTTSEVNKLEKENLRDEDKIDHRQTLNNRIQEFGAKTQLCKNIQNLYLKAINFLRKDQANHSAILEDMKEMAKLQQICIIRAVEMGQLATEEAANMREEYQKREQDVRANIEMHQDTLQAFQFNWSNLITESELFIRSESVSGLSGDFFGRTGEDETELQKEVHQLNDLLQSMRKATLVPGFDDIFPRMLEQIAQNEKLLEDLEFHDNLFDSLPKKMAHAKLVLAATVNEGEESAALFKSDRDKILSEVQELKEEHEAIDRKRQKVGDLVIQIKNSLATIWGIAESIPSLNEAHHAQDIEMNPGSGIRNDAQYYLQQLAIKADHLQEIVNKKIKDEYYQRMISKRAIELIKIQKNDDQKETVKVTIQIGDDDEDPSVPTRADIKAESKKIYDQATINPFA